MDHGPHHNSFRFNANISQSVFPSNFFVAIESPKLYDQ